MFKGNRWAAWAFALALPLAACGAEPEDVRAPLQEEELERELDLALQGDTSAPTFEDTAVAEEPEPPVRETPVRPTARRSPDAGSTPTRAPARVPARLPPAPAPAPVPEERAPRPQPMSRSAAVGTTFAVRLDETLSTEHNQPGDAFTATVSDPIYAADGRVLVPAGARVRGRVTAVDKSDRVGDTAVIKVAFESVSFGGESYPLKGSVVEARPERRTRTTRTEQAAKIGGATAAGAILGKVIGKDNQSALKGAIIGAAAGTAIAMGTAEVDAVLPTGSRMVIRLDAPIVVPVS